MLSSSFNKVIDKLVKDTPCYMLVCDDGSFQVLLTNPAVTWFGVYKLEPALFETHSLASTLAF